MREMEFRGHFAFLVVSKLLWSVLSIALIAVIFRQIDVVAGWTFDEMIVLTGSYLLVVGLGNVLFFPNMARLSESVNQGDLDFILIKPVASQFYVSARFVTIGELPAVLVAVFYVIVGLVRLDFRPGAPEIATYVALIFIALALLYAGWFLTVTLVIWSGRIENIHYLVYPFLELARVPADVFVGVFRPVVTLVVPIAFISTVPSRALLGLFDVPLILYGLGLAAALLAATRVVWAFALRRYSSASS